MINELRRQKQRWCDGTIAKLNYRQSDVHGNGNSKLKKLNYRQSDVHGNGNFRGNGILEAIP